MRTHYERNSFQYLRDNAIKIRGKPAEFVTIRDNVFAHEDEGDAIAVYDDDYLDEVIFIQPNVMGHDSYGQYGVCDFDGDESDDLFLATGKTWWFSSGGLFHWSYLATRNETFAEVRLGYFDDDELCDVLTEDGGKWWIASGGTAWWQELGSFDAPLSEVAFGRFDPNDPDPTPGATKQTTHAFQRASDGEWLVTPLDVSTMPSTPAWEHAQRSDFPMDELRFGDFTGDGITDVLAVEGGEWSISDGAHGSWETLNSDIDVDVDRLLIADLDANGIDDLVMVELEVIEKSKSQSIDVITLWISEDGRAPWRKLATHEVEYSGGSIVPLKYFAGRFGGSGRGAVLVVDRFRRGTFVDIEGTKWTARYEY